MRISDWSSDVCSSDLLVALIIAGIALQKEQNVGAAAILLRNLRPVSLKVTARTRKVNDAGRRIVEVADLLGREVIHQRLGLGRRLALERRVENAVEGPKIAIGSMALHPQQAVERPRGRDRKSTRPNSSH